MKSIRAAFVLFFTAPGVALASPSAPQLVARELPVRGGAVVSQPPHSFDLVGLHWRGSGTIRFRTQSANGRWSGWRVSAPESDDLPDRQTSEARRSRGWQLGNPFWVGNSTRIQYRLRGHVQRLRAFFVRSPLLPSTPRTAESFLTNAPTVITRAQWGANEKIRRDSTAHYADEVHLALVHHTAGSNNYSRSQSASIVRAIEVYHVLGNGWDDIGYNFLVDKYGQVFEGRYGGMERPVVGAHAMGFNYGSVGAALIGNYSGVGMTAAERSALVKLLAWRLDVSHVDPLSRVTRVSTGNPRYHQGTSVQLRAISGHRDAYPTECPGNTVYAQLPSIAREVAATGLPKIYTPIVFGGLGQRVRFTARLSSALPWTVTVTDAFGRVVASGTGRGRAVDWTWDATLAPRTRYTYTIAAGGTGAQGARPVIGTLGQVAPQLSVTQLRVQPRTVTPNGDGVGDEARITYMLGTSAVVTVTLTDDVGNTLATLFTGVMSKGAHSFVWNQIGVPDGRYRITIGARGSSGKEVSSTTSFYVDRTLAHVRVTPAVISPNGDGRVETASLSFSLSTAAVVKVEVRRAGKLLAKLFQDTPPAGTFEVPWDGKVGGRAVADGSYELVVGATDSLTTVIQRAVVAVDRTPPRLRLVSRARMQFWSSEPATISASFDGRRVSKHVRRGYFSFPLMRGARHFALVGTDAVGNTSRPLRG